MFLRGEKGNFRDKRLGRIEQGKSKYKRRGIICWCVADVAAL